MTQFNFDFLERRRLPVLGVALLGIAVLIGGIGSYKSAALRQEELEESNKIATLKRNLQEKLRIQIDSRTQVDPNAGQQKALQQVVSSLNYPWTRVLQTVEHSVIGDIAVLSLEHDQNNGVTRLTVEAIDLPTLNNMVAKLNEGVENAPWYISSLQSPNQSPPTVKAVILSR